MQIINNSAPSTPSTIIVIALHDNYSQTIEGINILTGENRNFVLSTTDNI